MWLETDSIVAKNGFPDLLSARNSSSVRSKISSSQTPQAVVNEEFERVGYDGAARQISVRLADDSGRAFLAMPVEAVRVADHTPEAGVTETFRGGSVAAAVTVQEPLACHPENVLALLLTPIETVFAPANAGLKISARFTVRLFPDEDTDEATRSRVHWLLLIVIRTTLSVPRGAAPASQQFLLRLPRQQLHVWRSLDILNARRFQWPSMKTAEYLPRHSYLCRSARSYADGYAQYATLPRGT